MGWSGKRAKGSTNAKRKTKGNTYIGHDLGDLGVRPMSERTNPNYGVAQRQAEQAAAKREAERQRAAMRREAAARAAGKPKRKVSKRPGQRPRDPFQ